jgi:hypothetical protein
MHASTVHWLHREPRIATEAIVVLHRRLMVWVVSSVVVPCSAVIVKVILVVMLLVVHLQLAHIEWLWNKSKSGIRARVGAVSVSDTKQSGLSAFAPWCCCTLGAWVTSDRARACMHEMGSGS